MSESALVGLSKDFQAEGRLYIAACEAGQVAYLNQMQCEGANGTDREYGRLAGIRDRHYANLRRMVEQIIDLDSTLADAAWQALRDVAHRADVAQREAGRREMELRHALAGQA